MLSKLLPWDFVLKYPTTIDLNKFGIHACLIEDPYLERALSNRLPRKDYRFALYSGNEVTIDLLEENFVNLSFFSEQEHLFIMNAETMSAETMSFLLESDIGNRIEISKRFLLLFFSKSNKQFNELTKRANSTNNTKTKNDYIHAMELEMPRFWEGGKLWQFAQKIRDVQFDGSIASFALENLEHNFESFFWLIDILKINFPTGAIDLQELRSLVQKNRWDFFEMIDHFHRSPKLLFQEILKKEMDYDWMRTLSSFMQNHFIKILFPEEIKAKRKLSKYDQSVLEMNETLDRDVIKYYMVLFSELEIMAKSHDAFLIDKLRLEVLK